jgi:hypothetical protein
MGVANEGKQGRTKMSEAAYIEAFTEMALNMGHTEEDAAKVGAAYGARAWEAKLEEDARHRRTPCLLS